MQRTLGTAAAAGSDLDRLIPSPCKGEINADFKILHYRLWGPRQVYLDMIFVRRKTTTFDFVSISLPLHQNRNQIEIRENREVQK